MTAPQPTSDEAGTPVLATPAADSSSDTVTADASEHLSSPRQRLLYLVAAIAQGIGAIAVQPFAIRLMSAEEWGKASFLLSLIAISLVAITAGFPLALSALYFDPQRGIAKARALNGFGGSVSIVVGLVAALVVWLFSAFTGTPSEAIYYIAVLIITMHGVSQMALAFLRSGGRAGSYVVVIVLATVAGHFVALASLILIRPTALVYITSVAVCVLLAAAIGTALTKPGSPFSERAGIRAAIRMGLPVLPHSLALIIMQQGESVLLMISEGEAVVGFYNAVMPLALGPIAVALALGNVWQTVLISLQGERSARAESIQREAATVAFLLTLVAVGGSTFATHVLVKIPSLELFQLARILPLVGVGYIAFIIASSQMFAVRRTALMSVITPVVALIELACMIIPASTGDLFAIGVVKVCAYMLLGIVFAFAARRSGSYLVLLSPIVLSMAASVAIAAVALFLPTDLLSSVVIMVVALVLAAGIGVVVVRKRRGQAPLAAESIAEGDLELGEDADDVTTAADRDPRA